MPKILIVDDEYSIRFSLQRTLKRDGYEVTAADSGQKALHLINRQEFDLALIDLQLRDMTGLEVLTTLRRQAPDTVAIILTGYASLDTCVQALRHGAHDYLFKPSKTVELRESIRRGLLDRQQRLKQHHLMRQIKSLAQSIDTPDGMATNEAILTDGAALPSFNPTQGRFIQRDGLLVDVARQVITLDGHLIELSPTEFDLLAYLAEEAPRVVSPQELVQAVQAYESEPWESNQIARQHIYRIRHKIKETTGRTDVIRTVRSKGYTVN